MMLEDSKTPVTVKQAAKDFLSVLAEEDHDETLGSTALIGDESQTSDGEEGDDSRDRTS